MNLQQASKHIIQQLKSVYEEREAKNICSILLEEYTGLSKTQRLINSNFELTQHQQTLIDTALQQLLQHKPLQQILGYAWFYGNKFLVDENTLIPRPETEELVDLIVKENGNKKISILDIGTGSGCIAISLKKTLPNTAVTAIDVSNETLNIAKQNAASINTEINFSELDFLNEDQWKALPLFDLIVSNPPYISIEEKAEMKKNVLDFEPHLALFTPDNDVLVFYRKIAAFATTHLNSKGKIYVEINETLGKETAEIFTSKGFEPTIIKDLQGKDRMIMAVQK